MMKSGGVYKLKESSQNLPSIKGKIEYGELVVPFDPEHLQSAHI